MQVLDLRSWTWSKVEVKSETESLESPSTVPLPPCAGHSLVSVVFYIFYFPDISFMTNLLTLAYHLLKCILPVLKSTSREIHVHISLLFFWQIQWENKLLSIAGHTKDPSETIQGTSQYHSSIFSISYKIMSLLQK